MRRARRDGGHGRGRGPRGHGADSAIRDRDNGSLDDTTRDVHHAIGGEDHRIGARGPRPPPPPNRVNGRLSRCEADVVHVPNVVRQAGFIVDAEFIDRVTLHAEH